LHKLHFDQILFDDFERIDTVFLGHDPTVASGAETAEHALPPASACLEPGGVGGVGGAPDVVCPEELAVLTSHFQFEFRLVASVQKRVPVLAPPDID